MIPDDLLAVHRLRPDDLGSGAVPLVLLHGFPLDGRMWDEVAALLPSGREVLAIDLPGLGGSPTGEDVASGVRAAGVEVPQSPSLEAAAEAVLLTLQRHGTERAVVAGLSMGGYVAMALLERHPELVAGLALLDTRAEADGAEAVANRLRIADTVIRESGVEAVRPMATSLLGETSRTTRHDLVDRLRAWIDDQSPDGVAWSQRAMAARPDRTSVLRSFAGPALVIVGDEDTVTPVETARTLHEDLAGSVLVVVPHAGHMTAVERPGSVADALADLAARVDSRAEPSD